MDRFFTFSPYVCLFLTLFRHEATALKLSQEVMVASATITTPPSLPSECPTKNLLRRAQSSCSFGVCGSSCLAQGAFCCNPGGSLALNPLWVCDNGACITSVRGNTGIVDCYDPDNPSGTTQSCIDNKPTATCHSTDRCYTCSTDVPFCHWQTWVETNSPSLRWFSCVSSSMPDETFFAHNATARASPQSSNNSSDHVLSTGAIVGIAVGGGVFMILLIALVTCFCVRRRTNPKPEMVHDRAVASPGTDANGDAGFGSTSKFAKRASPQSPLHEMPTPTEPGYYTYGPGSGKLGMSPKTGSGEWDGAGGVRAQEACSTPIAELPTGMESPPRGGREKFVPYSPPSNLAPPYDGRPQWDEHSWSEQQWQHHQLQQDQREPQNRYYQAHQQQGQQGGGGVGMAN